MLCIAVHLSDYIYCFTQIGISHCGILELEIPINLKVIQNSMIVFYHHLNERHEIRVKIIQFIE